MAFGMQGLTDELRGQARAGKPGQSRGYLPANDINTYLQSPMAKALEQNMAQRQARGAQGLSAQLGKGNPYGGSSSRDRAMAINASQGANDMNMALLNYGQGQMDREEERRWREFRMMNQRADRDEERAARGQINPKDIFGAAANILPFFLL